MTIIAIGKPLTPPKNFFNWCENQIPTYQWKNKEQTILASNRKDCPLIEKRLTKKSRLTFGTKFYPFTIILVSKNRIEIQSHDYWQDIENGKETLVSEMANFERFENGKHIKAHLWNNHYHEGLLSNYGFMSGPYTNTIYYPNNWNEKLKTNRDMKYLDLPEIDRIEIKRIYNYRHQIEYLQKINATTLANDFMFATGKTYQGSYYSAVDTRVANQKWLKKHKAILKQTNPTFNAVMIGELMKGEKGKRLADIENKLHYKQLKALPNEINRTKFQKYIVEKNISFNYYMDYIRMLDELNIALNDNNIVFPKDLPTAHDEVVATINQLEKELDEQAYQRRQTKLRKLEKEIDNFVFLVPKELQEIVKEGNALHHCVGSNYYLQNHKSGETNIVFIRRKDDSKTPYFTMEYRNGKVVQIQGKFNRETVPNEVQNAITKWEKKVATS